MDKDGHGMKLVKKISRYERLIISFVLLLIFCIINLFRLQEVLATSMRTTRGLTNEVSVVLCGVFVKL